MLYKEKAPYYEYEALKNYWMNLLEDYYTEKSNQSIPLSKKERTSRLIDLIFRADKALDIELCLLPKNK